MFFAYDAAFTGPGAGETVGERRERKAREREGSFSSGSSSSDRTAPSTLAPSDSASLKPHSSESRGSALGFAFGFNKKAKRNEFKVHARTLSDESRPGTAAETRSRSNSISDIGTATDSRDRNGSSNATSFSHTRSPSRAFSPEPRVARMPVGRGDGYSNSTKSMVVPIGLDESVAKRFEQLGIKSSKSMTALNEPPEPQYSRSPRKPLRWTDPDYEETHGESSVLNLFPLAGDPAQQNSRGQSGYDQMDSMSERLSSLSGPSGAPSSVGTFGDRGFKPGRLPTIVDEEAHSRPSSSLSKHSSPRSRALSPQPRRNRQRSGQSSPKPYSPKSKSRFQSTLAQMEVAPLKMMEDQLAEDYSEYAGSENIDDAIFEQKLWSLVARQWLTGGKQLQCPRHEALSTAKPEDGRKILNLYGSAADGWVLAAKYPGCIVITLTTSHINSPHEQNHTWTAPPNHHMSYIQATDDHFPFPDNHFDVIVSRSFSTVVKARKWLPVLQECHRCLQSGGWLEIQSLDAIMNRQGELLNAWVARWLLPGLKQKGFIARPSERVDYFEIAGFGGIRTCRIALPTATKACPSDAPSDATGVMVEAGRHYYEELYGDFLKIGVNGRKQPWWWMNNSIRQECEDEGTLFGFMISFGQKEFV